MASEQVLSASSSSSDSSCSSSGSSREPSPAPVPAPVPVPVRPPPTPVPVLPQKSSSSSSRKRKSNSRQQQSKRSKYEDKDKRFGKSKKPKERSASHPRASNSTPVAIAGPSKLTAKDIMGTDSDIDEDQSVGKKDELISYICRRGSNGVSKQMNPNLQGLRFVDFRLYLCSEIENVTPMNRWRHSIVTLKTKIDEDKAAYRYLVKFLMTGEYRGAAHSQCNLLYRVCPFIPVVFHNLTNYDAHLFINELSKYEGDIKVIPKTKEKYITFTKFLREDSRSSIQIKFLDSCQFLNSSLDNLSKNLTDVDFKHLRREFDTKEKFDLLREKGIYPYDYMNSWSRFDEKCLPKKDFFYNSLTCEHITDKDYQRALKIWQVFNVKTLGDYTDLYLKCDVLLLCDIFEKFRISSLQYYKLDPAYYVTSPGLSWDAMLLYTGVKLDLLDDIEMYEMIEQGIRGGLAQCSLRHAKANNKHMPEYDESKPSSYLLYLDCTNLYGYAMMKKLPMSEFRFLSDKEIKKLDVINISDSADYGYILEVDLSYPDHLHTAHSDLPFAPEKHVPPGGKNKKLIANLYDKFNYVIHYAYLKECLKNGLILKKIHRAITFRQDNFLAKYIDLNTRLRQAATSQFDKDFFKLLNNAIFGKTIENRRKQVDVRLVTRWSDNTNKTKKRICAQQLISKPNLKSIAIFSENFVAIQLSLEKITLDRPIYVGFTVLEYAKQHMYQFHYSIIKKKYENNVKLCYTDTDSFLYLINTNDVYCDVKNNISHFDTSNFEKNNVYGIPIVNAKIPGFFKDEMGGEIIKEFIGLRAKLYCINSTKSQIQKAKGVTKTVTKKLTPFHYANALHRNVNLRCPMNIIRCFKHVLYSQKVNKLVLNRNDDKRQILKNQIDTLPWGHCDTLS